MKQNSSKMMYTLSTYHNRAKEDRRILQGGDAEHLVDTFEDRARKENDFFLHLSEQDSDDHLVSFFWRDSHMKIKYLLFEVFLVFHTTYQTNKYGMICFPFVCMNHYANNVMVSYGFLLMRKSRVSFGCSILSLDQWMV